MRDRRMDRIYRQLGSVNVVLNAAVREAESLADQRLADDLQKRLWELQEIHRRMPENGRKYRPL